MENGGEMPPLLSFMSTRKQRKLYFYIGWKSVVENFRLSIFALL